MKTRLCAPCSSPSQRQERIELPAAGGLVDPGEVPEPPEEPVTQARRPWLLGEHKLLCGDSTEAEDVQRLMAGERASLMATDPPYLVDYNGGNHPQTWTKDGRPISSEEKTKHWDAYTDQAGRGLLRRLPRRRPGRGPDRAPDDLSVVRHDARRGRAGGLAGQQPVGSTRSLIWHKSRSVLTRCDFMWDYEPAPYGWVQGQRPASDRRPPANANAPSGRSLARAMMAPGGASDLKPMELDPPPDRVAHPARRAHLRALLRLGHGHHRGRDHGPALLCHRACPGHSSTSLCQMAAPLGSRGDPRTATAAASPRSPPRGSHSPDGR